MSVKKEKLKWTGFHIDRYQRGLDNQKKKQRKYVCWKNDTLFTYQKRYVVSNQSLRSRIYKPAFVYILYTPLRAASQYFSKQKRRVVQAMFCFPTEDKAWTHAVHASYARAPAAVRFNPELVHVREVCPQEPNSCRCLVPYKSVVPSVLLQAILKVSKTKNLQKLKFPIRWLLLPRI
jgi:hypothetical protein